jgi:ornithine cyclodeaminase/alanine dehydrogenase-like protein (mu-crystallin family)
MQTPVVPAVEPVLILNRTDVLSLFTWPGLIDGARRALIQEADPLRPGHVPGSSTQVPLPGASLHVKVGVQAVPPILSLKANLRPDDGDSSGGILVFDLDRQRLRAIVASADITALRTAAIAAVAASHLLSAPPVVVAILGAGPVGKRVDEALLHLGIASEVRWWSRRPDNAAAAVAGAPGEVPHARVDTVGAAVADAKLVVTCTPAREPILSLEDLDAEAIVLAMGADTPGKRELGPGIVETAGEIYADVPAAVLTAGESAHLPAGEVGRIRSLGSALASRDVKNDRRTQRTRVIFDSVGSSAVDAATVALLVEDAVLKSVGSWIDLEA